MEAKTDVAIEQGNLDELFRNFRADRRADRRRRATLAADAGCSTRARMGQRASDTGGEAAGRHPDAQDADGQRVGRRAEASGSAGTQGQCVRNWSEASALDIRAA